MHSTAGKFGHFQYYIHSKYEDGLLVVVYRYSTVINVAEILQK